MKNNKLELAFIVPTAYIEEFGNQGDFHLALSHLIDKNNENEYEKKLKASGKKILLDNGLFEHHTPEDLDSLMFKAVKIGATHFFAPDLLFDSVGTEKELKRAIDKKNHHDLKDLKIAAVVQADNYENYIQQLLEFNNNKDVDLIGLSILSIPKSFYDVIGRFDITESRIFLLNKMIEMAIEQGIVWKKCHLLGLGDSFEDVIFAKMNCPWVVSNDTSCAFQTGLYERKLTDELEVPGGKIKEKVNFELEEITNTQRECIKYNINKINQIIK